MSSWQTIPTVADNTVSDNDWLNAVIADMTIAQNPNSAYWIAAGTEPDFTTVNPTSFDVGDAVITTNGVSPLMIAWALALPSHTTLTVQFVQIHFKDSSGVSQGQITLQTGAITTMMIGFNAAQLTLSGVDVLDGSIVGVLPPAGTYNVCFRIGWTTSGGTALTFSYANLPRFLVWELP